MGTLAEKYSVKDSAMHCSCSESFDSVTDCGRQNRKGIGPIVGLVHHSHLQI